MKKPDIKSLFINHVEKIAFGFFGLIALLILAQTNWERYSKTPDALKQDVQAVRDKIAAKTNVWPAAERQEFKIVDFTDKARQLFAPMGPIAIARYSFTPPLFYPLHHKDEPRREPTFETVQYLIAKPGLAALSIAKHKPTSTTTEEPAEKVAMEDTRPGAEDDEFTRRPSGGGTTKAAGGGAPGNAHAAHAGRPGGPPGGPPRPGGAINPPSGALNRPPMPTGAGNAGNMQLFGRMPSGPNAHEEVAVEPTVEARGVRLIAVRGVYPLAKQIESFKNSMKISQTEAQSKLEIADFILERQTAIPGPDPWDENLTKWEVVNIETALEVLSDCSDTDPNDPVPVALRDAVITMSLPLRLIGAWVDYATHPKIKDLELNSAGIEQQNSMLESLDETLSESQTAEQKKPRQRGLAPVQRDVKSMVTAVKSSSTNMEMYKAMMSQMGAAAGPNGGAPGRPMTNPGMFAGPGGVRGPSDLDRLVATQKYLLFRYFDFDVEPGMAYRYRVRLKIRNPNFELSPEELAGADPEIANGEERDTPWSNISNPAVVDTTLNYYLQDVDREPYREEKVKVIDGKPVARVNVFDWDTTLGTVVEDVLNLPAIGAFIGGIGGGPKKETKVLDLVKGEIVKKKDRKVTSLDVLVDVESEFDIPVDQHPDLKLTSNTDKKGTYRLSLAEEALVAIHTGELKILNPTEDVTSEDRWKFRLKKEREDFKEGSAAPKNRQRGRLDALSGDTQEDTSTGKKKKKRTRTLIRQEGAQTPPG